MKCDYSQAVVYSAPRTCIIRTIECPSLFALFLLARYRTKYRTGPRNDVGLSDPPYDMLLSMTVKK